MSFSGTSLSKRNKNIWPHKVSVHPGTQIFTLSTLIKAKNENDSCLLTEQHR
jgi:hypothetical protein